MVARAPRNHPRQIALRGGDPDLTDVVDCRETPADFFAVLHAEHGFTLDAAANADNAKLPRFFDRAQDGLAQSWAGEIVWCNPPYSNLWAWVAKAIAETRAGCPKVVMLLPGNRTEQTWWQEMIEPVRDRGLGVATRFLRGRLKFKGSRTAPEAIKQGENRPPFGCVLVTFTKQGGTT